MIVPTQLIWCLLFHLVFQAYSFQTALPLSHPFESHTQSTEVNFTPVSKTLQFMKHPLKSSSAPVCQIYWTLHYFLEMMYLLQNQNFACSSALIWTFKRTDHASSLEMLQQSSDLSEMASTWSHYFELCWYHWAHRNRQALLCWESLFDSTCLMYSS